MHDKALSTAALLSFFFAVLEELMIEFLKFKVWR